MSSSSSPASSALEIRVNFLIDEMEEYINKEKTKKKSFDYGCPEANEYDEIIEHRIEIEKLYVVLDYIEDNDFDKALEYFDELGYSKDL